MNTHSEHCRFSKYGVIVAMLLTECRSLQVCIRKYGNFFEGDCGLMWMPGFLEHARLPCHTADTSVDTSLTCRRCTVLETSDAELQVRYLQKVEGALTTALSIDKVTPSKGDVPAKVGANILSLHEFLDESKVCEVTRLGNASSNSSEVFSIDAGQCATPWHNELDRELFAFVSAGQLRQPSAGLKEPERFGPWVAKGVRRSIGPGERLHVTSDSSYAGGSFSLLWMSALRRNLHSLAAVGDHVCLF